MVFKKLKLKLKFKTYTQHTHSLFQVSRPLLQLAGLERLGLVPLNVVPDLVEGLVQLLFLLLHLITMEDPVAS